MYCQKMAKHIAQLQNFVEICNIHMNKITKHFTLGKQEIYIIPNYKRSTQNIFSFVIQLNVR